MRYTKAMSEWLETFAYHIELGPWVRIPSIVKIFLNWRNFKMSKFKITQYPPPRGGLRGRYIPRFFNINNSFNDLFSHPVDMVQDILIFKSKNFETD